MAAASVFVYGSLVAWPGARATLAGHRRTWGVAMDNSVSVPGYKRYRERTTGAHPDVRVAFLDLARDPGTEVEGVLLAADAAQLAALDARERNYERVMVTLADGTRAWTYRGSPAARARASQPPVVVVRAYLVTVRAAYVALGGEDALAAFGGSTDPPPGPLADLEREEL